MTYRPAPIRRIEEPWDDGYSVNPLARQSFTLGENPLRPVRCVDGLSRPQGQCVQTDEGWIYRGTS